MTSKLQKKHQKKIAREKESRQKVLALRTVLRTEARENLDDFRRDKRIRKIQRDLDQFDQVVHEGQLQAVTDDTLTQLEKNILILKSLEDQHNAEAEHRKKVNEELESQGCVTLEEKMAKAREILKTQCETELPLVDWAADEPRGDDAVVEVVKAPRGDDAVVEVVKAPEKDKAEFTEAASELLKEAQDDLRPEYDLTKLVAVPPEKSRRSVNKTEKDS